LFFREKHVKKKVVTQLAMNTEVKAKNVSNHQNVSTSYCF